MEQKIEYTDIALLHTHNKKLMKNNIYSVMLTVEGFKEDCYIWET